MKLKELRETEYCMIIYGRTRRAREEAEAEVFIWIYVTVGNKTLKCLNEMLFLLLPYGCERS
jgi:hypothetical protein